jgi:paraquat-inducible protein A
MRNGDASMTSHPTRRRTRRDDEEYNTPLSDASLIACLHCDLLQRLPVLPPGASARCPRCDKELWRPREDSLNRTLALALAAAVLYVIANSVPMLGLTVVGHQAFTTVIGGANHLWENGQQIVAVLVLVTAVIAPALQIGFMLAIVLGTRRNRAPRWVGMLLRYHPTTRTWSMIEVMLLGVLVALIKIADYATVIPGIALFVLGTLVFLLAGIQSSFDPREVWNRVEWAEAGAPAAAAADRSAEATT